MTGATDNLMARIDAARDRLREAREEALAVTGGIKGVIVASLILEWQASKVTYELAENHKSITRNNRDTFMDQQRNALVEAIRNDPNHPLRSLLNANGEWIGRRFSYQAYSRSQVGIQAGHLRSGFAIRQELAGELERFALEDALTNNLDSRKESLEVIYEKTALNIGGFPVEATTARDYVAQGLIDADVVANAPEHPGWTAPNSVFTESIPDAAGSSQLRSILRGGSRALGPLGAAVDLYSLGDAIAEDGGTFGENTKTTVGGIAGGWGGAAAGAALGSLICPGVGTVVGGIIGGIGGGLLGESLGGLF